jgi:hypothetical protein
MWNDFGYPAASPYTGAWLVCTQASYARTDVSMDPDTTAIGTLMTGGCSGGPWVLKFMNGNYANGLNSYIYTTPNQPQQIYSPYFDTWVYTNLYKVAIAR